MAFFIQFPDDPNAHGSAGAKASILARLTNEGLPVPPLFVVTSEAFSGNLSIEQRDAIAAAKTPMTLAAAVADLTLSESFLQEVDVALLRLCPNGEPVVVRPSLEAADVDSYEAASPLPVKVHTLRHQVGERIASIYKAAHSEPVLLHRRRHHLPLCPDPPAILIQRLISPEASGAAFGSDLTTGQRAISVIAAVVGLPSSMSSGDCHPDLYRVDRNGKVVQRDIATKKVSHRPSAEEPSGYVSRDVPHSQEKAPVLGAKAIARIWAMLSDVERSFECPQEIQWALETDKLYLLGASPLTQLDRHSDPDAPKQYLDAGALAELFPDAVLPLTVSIAQRAAPHIARAFLAGAGLSDRVVAGRAHAIHALLGIVRSRIYANLENWYALFAVLPDYPFNARYYGRMAGWTLGLPPAVERRLRRGKTPSSAGFLTALALYRGFAGMSGRVMQFHKRVRHALKAMPKSIERARLDELADCYRMLEGRLLPFWDAPPLNEYYTLIAYGYLNQHVQQLWPEEHSQALVGLLSKSGGKWLPPSIGKIHEIAVTIARDRETLHVLGTGSLDEIFDLMTGQPMFRSRCEDYVAKYGGLSFGGCKLEAASLADDPLPLFRAIAQAATSLSIRGEDDAVVLDIPNREDVLAAPNLSAYRRWKLKWLTNHTLARLRDRELMSADVARVVAAVRALFTEIGRRYYALGLLESPRDVFYLTVDEVLGFIDASNLNADIAGTVQTRRSQFEDLERRPPPMASFAAFLPVSVGNQIEQRPDPTVPERRGTGVSPGFVRGRVWMAGSAKPPSVDGPFVLAVPYADPSWPLLYPGVDGIIIEKGSALSPAVLEYRDQRISTVLGVPNLTTWLANGDLVDMDGLTGIVRKVDDSDPVYAVKSAGSVIKKAPVESPVEPEKLDHKDEKDHPIASEQDTGARVPQLELPNADEAEPDPPSAVEGETGMDTEAPAESTELAEIGATPEAATDAVAQSADEPASGGGPGRAGQVQVQVQVEDNPDGVGHAEADAGIITSK